MKLKGKNAEKLNPAKRKKMEKTLKKMEKTRIQDTRHLRDIIKAKLDWATKEKAKGLKTVEMLNNQVLGINRQLIKLDGILLVLNELVNLKKEESDKE